MIWNERDDWVGRIVILFFSFYILDIIKSANSFFRFTKAVGGIEHAFDSAADVCGGTADDEGEIVAGDEGDVFGEVVGCGCGG